MAKLISANKPIEVLRGDLRSIGVKLKQLESLIYASIMKLKILVV